MGIEPTFRGFADLSLPIGYRVLSNYDQTNDRTGPYPRLISGSTWKIPELPLVRTSEPISYYSPKLSFTATEISCSDPRYRSVV